MFKCLNTEKFHNIKFNSTLTAGLTMFITEVKCMSHIKLVDNLLTFRDERINLRDTI
jgi:hypothetical protein